MTDTMRGFEVNTREANEDEVNTHYDTVQHTDEVGKC